ncbi:unnamed protein product, partial [Haemonchus placei]|uniref:Transmembrane protein n=1 Tax=Haemonchus placei TaxID=6290 RepID=A0A0N4WVG5_HAEPC
TQPPTNNGPGDQRRPQGVRPEGDHSLESVSGKPMWMNLFNSSNVGIYRMNEDFLSVSFASTPNAVSPPCSIHNHCYILYILTEFYPLFLIAGLSYCVALK